MSGLTTEDMTTQGKKAETNRKRAESVRRAWVKGTGKLKYKKRKAQQPCKCGCGKLAALDRLYAQGCYNPGAAHLGKKRSEEWRAKIASGVARASARGAFAEGCRKRSEKALAKRPLCSCGCGQPVRAAKAKYAKGCFDATTPENQAKARAARDMEKLKAQNSKQMKKQMEKWKASGKLHDIRRKAGNAKGMLDHLSAKSWNIRDPFGYPHQFSNLAEWARQNYWRFEDDRPQSTTPFWKRIAGGIIDLLKANGRSCSYRGWTAISKKEIEASGADFLGRDYFLQNGEQIEACLARYVEIKREEAK
jgi:hypothetical protein